MTAAEREQRNELLLLMHEAGWGNYFVCVAPHMIKNAFDDDIRPIVVGIVSAF